MDKRLIKRFWGYVLIIEKDGCWLWQGAINSRGYGSFGYKGKIVQAHRLSWEICFDKPKNSILHKCDNKTCVNPDHLFEGTQRDNMRDMVNKRRYSREGLIIPDRFIQRIINLKGRVTQSKIAKIFGVTSVHIGAIQSGKRRYHEGVRV